ncbi:hypothetical protein HK097_004782, partial [Rhizophlyctis rosea]
MVTLFVSLFFMAFEYFPVDMTMFGTVFIFVFAGIIDLPQATEGFSNEGMLIVMVFFIISAAVRNTGCLEPIRWLLTYTGKKNNPQSTRITLLKLFYPIGLLSCWLENTSIVVMMIPVLQEVANKLKISPSKLMIPLSYAAIFGGTCTLVGTSSNLVAYHLASIGRPDEINSKTFGLFTLGQVGLPAFLAGGLYVVNMGITRMLPNRIPVSDVILNPREYLLTARVTKPKLPSSKVAGVEQRFNPKIGLVGKTIRKSKISSLKELTLVQAERNRQVFTNPDDDYVLQEGDYLYFAGRVESLLELQTISGIEIVPDEDHHIDLRDLKNQNTVYEVVIGPSSKLIDRTITDLKFRSEYDAAIVAVHRDGSRIDAPLASITLQPGDVLLLIASASFLNSSLPDFRTFSMVRKVRTVQPPRSYIRAFLTASFLVVAIIISSFKGVSLLTCGVAAAGAMLLIQALSPREARDSLQWEVLIVVAASFGLGNAMTQSGAADIIAKALLSASAPSGLIGLKITVYVVTVFLNAILSNNAAVAVVYPIVDAACRAKGEPFFPFLLILMMAGSADFSTPIGYQCNLMVYAPGGYKFWDYAVFGAPLQVITGVVTIG